MFDPQKPHICGSWTTKIIRTFLFLFVVPVVCLSGLFPGGKFFFVAFLVLKRAGKQASEQESS